MRSTRLNIAASVAAACVAVLLAAQSTQAQTYTVLHTFFGRGGRVPVAGVIQDAEGNLYGTTAGGGAPDNAPDERQGTQNRQAYSKLLHDCGGLYYYLTQFGGKSYHLLSGRYPTRFTLNGFGRSRS